jgi:hypothetical protein
MASGTNTSVETPRTIPVKPAGPTPTTVNGRPLSAIVRPITAGSPPKRMVVLAPMPRASETMATAVKPGLLTKPGSQSEVRPELFHGHLQAVCLVTDTRPRPG